MDSIFSGFSNAYKQNHIINDIIFPGSSSNSYSWGMFQQDELICLQTTGPKAMEIPCLLIKGYQREGDRRTMLPASTLLVYCHANSEDLGSVYPCAKWMSQMLGIHVLVPEYPGYGLCSGSPNEQSINAAVQAACQFAIEELMQDASRIIIYGRSIGTGPSVLAARARLAGTCVLISPYSSIKEIVEFHVGSVIGLLAHGASEWDSKRLIEDVQVPTLIIHGTSDDIIPSRHAEELYERCPARKRLVLLENVGHQEMDLLYALVQTLPEIHHFSDEPWEINLENLDHVLFECRTANSPTGEERIVPVYKIAPREGEVEVEGGHREDRGQAFDGEGNIGNRVIGGRDVLVV